MQRVVDDDGDVTGAGDARFERGNEVLVELEREHPSAGFGERDGQGSKAGSDLEDVCAGGDVREAHDATRGVRIGEEVLPERATRCEVMVREEGAHH